MNFFAVSRLSASRMSADPTIFFSADGEDIDSGDNIAPPTSDHVSLVKMEHDPMNSEPYALMTPDLCNSAAFARCLGRTARRRWNPSASDTSGAKTMNLCRAGPCAAVDIVCERSVVFKTRRCEGCGRYLCKFERSTLREREVLINQVQLKLAWIMWTDCYQIRSSKPSETK